MVDGFPRRNRMEHMAGVELCILESIRAIELEDADPRLSRAQMLVQEALDLVGDVVDERNGEQPTQPPAKSDAVDLDQADLRREVGRLASLGLMQGDRE